MSNKKSSTPETSLVGQATTPNASANTNKKGLAKTRKEPKPKKMSCLDDHFTNA